MTHRPRITGTLHRTRRGFTLIETILYIGISAIVLVSLTQITLSVLSARQKTGTLGELQYTMRFALERISTAVLEADSVDAEASTLESDAGVLALTMDAAERDPTIISLVNGAIYFREGAETPQTLTSPGVIIDQLRFSDRTKADTNGTIAITLHGTDASNSDDDDYQDELTIRTSLSLRQ